MTGATGAILTGLVGGLVEYMYGSTYALPQEAFRQTSLAWYRRKRTVWVEVVPVEGVWTAGDVLPDNPSPGSYSRYHPVEIDLSWFGVLPDSAWRVRSEQDRKVLKLWRYMYDSLRLKLAEALDAPPASTATELTELLDARDLNPWTEEVPTEDGWYLVAAQRPDVEPGAVHLSLYEVRLGSRQAWWSKCRVAFRRVTVDSRVWTSPSWSESRHQRRVAELRAASDAAQAAFAAVMDEEKALREETAAKEQALRARFEEAKRRKEEAFQAWEDEMNREPF